MFVRLGLYQNEKRYQGKPEEYADKIMLDDAFANEFINYALINDHELLKKVSDIFIKRGHESVERQGKLLAEIKEEIAKHYPDGNIELRDAADILLAMQNNMLVVAKQHPEVKLLLEKYEAEKIITNALIHFQDLVQTIYRENLLAKLNEPQGPTCRLI